MFFLKLSMSILSLLSLEVKEISGKMRRFGPRLPQKPVARFGTLPTPEPSERPAFNGVISAP